MTVTFTCPHCERTAVLELAAAGEALVCRSCGARVEAPAGTSAGNGLDRCLACPSTDLFVRKDFPQRLGVAIAVFGFGASLVAWHHYWIYTTFGILFATALADLALFHLMGNVLVCYRCGALYRNVPGMESHGAFNLETHERYRQQAARLDQHTAAAAPDAPRK